VHRGKLQMVLYDALIERAGADCITTNARAVGFENGTGSADLLFENGNRVTGDLIIAADGIHSALRAQMVPDEGAPIWNGRVLWRATTESDAYFGGAAMVMIGHDNLRVVAYPISDPDPETNIATINWIAEKKFDLSDSWKKEDWNRAADITDFLPDFADWKFDWIDVPALITGADVVYEYPMVVRDPLNQWTQGRVTLMGDAAHPTYPVGSNGAGQAIIDARVIGARLLDHGITPDALEAFKAEIRPIATGVGRANRAGGGPDGVLQQVEDLCGGDFEDINDVISQADLAAHAEKYKTLAGFSIETLNAKPRIVPQGARLT